MFAFGLLVQFSSGHGDSRSFFLHQLLLFLLFLPFAVFLFFVKANIFYRYSYLFFVLSFVLLVFAFFIGVNAMGATRWIKFLGFQFQPSELIKIGIVLLLARYISDVGLKAVNSVFILFFMFLIVLCPLYVILKQPNLGTAIIISCIVMTILFSVGMYYTYVIFFVCALLVSIPIIWKYLLYDYQKVRILTFFNVENDKLTTGYNVLQSKIAIGSGGFCGRGFLSGTQTQLKFLPEKHTDFAFTVLAEEFGFLGSVLVFLLYYLLISSIIRITKYSDNIFYSITIVGVASIFSFHFLINVSMVMGALPVVGVPLPFISYGGSVLLSSMISISIVLSINKSIYALNNI
ncbi:rod shape-determining protein RodA [Anaplasmataceae bacterium AB001_6]|nr:rod shape-determining protein RodA [Anaplasmataceae bacterium AB001_6]